MAIAMGRGDAFGAQEEDKAFEQCGVSCQPNGFELLVSVLLRAFVIQPRFPHGGDDDPVAREIDRVAIGLVHGGHAPPGKRAIQRIAGALAFEDRDEFFFILLEATEHGVRDLAVHFDVALAGKGEGVRRSGGAGVSEQAAKDVSEEIREQSGFLEIIRAAGSDEGGPMLEFGLPVFHRLREAEGPYLLTDDLRVKEGLGFDSHCSIARQSVERGAQSSVRGQSVASSADSSRLGMWRIYMKSWSRSKGQ